MPRGRKKVAAFDHPQVQKYAVFTNARKDLTEEQKTEAIQKYANGIAKSQQARQGTEARA